MGWVWAVEGADRYVASHQRSWRRWREAAADLLVAVRSVLNVSNCKMSALPEQFASLSSLKAFVATGNEFEELDSEIVGKWKDLNSLSQSLSPPFHSFGLTR